MWALRFLFSKAMEREVEEIYQGMLKKHALDAQLDHASDREQALHKSHELPWRHGGKEPPPRGTGKATGWAAHSWGCNLEKVYGPKFGFNYKTVEASDGTRRFFLTK